VISCGKGDIMREKACRFMRGRPVTAMASEVP
jgi:hypothetical protein